MGEVLMIYLIQPQQVFCYGRDIHDVRNMPISGLSPLPASAHDHDVVPVQEDATPRRYDHDAPIRRPRNKELTLRSWRNPRAIGGTHSRKATYRAQVLRISCEG